MGIIDNIKHPLDYVTRQAEELAGSLQTTQAVQTVQSTFSVETPEQGKMKRTAQHQYKYTTINYPSSLGEGTRHPHYMTFFINVQDLSKWSTTGKGGSLALVKGERIHSTVAINQAQSPTYGRNIAGTNLGFARKTSRTKTAIRLFMPDTLAWSYRHGYRDPHLSGIPGAKGGQAIAGAMSMAEDYMQGGTAGVLANIGTTGRATAGPAVETTLGSLMGDEALALSALGLAVNPQIDVIYDSPTLREFNFEFVFAPRNADEGRQVQQIVKLFKFHSAPEMLSEGGVFGRYFVPPSEFDIEFSVPTMGKISTCVLQDVTVDYGSSGAAFYSDKTPVYTKLLLGFKELEFITKNLIDEQGY
jgi:hypothetical protein